MKITGNQRRIQPDGGPGTLWRWRPTSLWAGPIAYPWQAKKKFLWFAEDPVQWHIQTIPKMHCPPLRDPCWFQLIDLWFSGWYTSDLLIIRSITRQQVDVMEMGLWFPGELVGPFACMGVNAIFQSKGGFWSRRYIYIYIYIYIYRERERERWGSGKAIARITYFKMMLGMPSGPEDSGESRLRRVVFTITGGHSDCLICVGVLLGELKWVGRKWRSTVDHGEEARGFQRGMNNCSNW